MDADTPVAIRDLFDFDNVSLEASTEFWTVYLLGGYQYTAETDEDPESEGADTTVGVADQLNGQGAIVFWETSGLNECSISTVPSPPFLCSIEVTAAHEIAHLLGADDGEGGIMSFLSQSFTPISILRMREATHP